MRKCWIFAALAMALLVACGNKNKVKEPKPLLTEQQMIDLLTDTYLIEAELNQKRTVGEDVAALQRVYYEQVFEHYGINDTVFEANMNYYSHDLPVLERIMDSVMNRFVVAQ